MKYKVLLLFVLCCLLGVNAQESKKTFLVMGIPQYMLINGIRVDLEKNLKGTKRWIVLSPELYNAEKGAVLQLYSGNYNYNKVKGYGCGLSMKQLFGSKNSGEGFYFSAGSGYRYFDISSEGVVWLPENVGSAVMVPSAGDLFTCIHQVNVNTTLGIQGELSSGIFVDIYVGFGIKYSFKNSEHLGVANLNNGYGSYGYSGTYPVVGLRFGVGF